MLYLSRLIHKPSSTYRVSLSTRCHYGVVDTDDDVEEVIDDVEFVDVVCNHWIEIAGIEFTGLNYLESTIPYQDIMSMTGTQTKLFVMSHVLVTLYKGMITGINFDGNLIDNPVSIVLADIGHSCADYLLTNCKNYDRHKITLVIDDRVKFTKHSFASASRFSSCIGVDGCGFAFDLRNLHDDSAAAVIYDNVFNSGSRTNSIFDSSERRHRMISKLIQG